MDKQDGTVQSAVRGFFSLPVGCEPVFDYVYLDQLRSVKVDGMNAVDTQ